MSLRQKVDSFRGDCFVITNDGDKIPLRVESIDFAPGYVGPEIHGYLLEHIRVKENDSPIKKVIFNNPATVVIWEDGTKTVVKCQEGDTYSEELGLAMCIAKKFFGNKGNFNEVFKKWIPKEPELSIEEMRQAITRHCTARNGIGCKGCAIDALPGHIVGRCAKYANDEEVVRHYRVIRKN